jgi:hypothetical protein
MECQSNNISRIDKALEQRNGRELDSRCSRNQGMERFWNRRVSRVLPGPNGQAVLEPQDWCR